MSERMSARMEGLAVRAYDAPISAPCGRFNLSWNREWRPTRSGGNGGQRAGAVGLHGGDGGEQAAGVGVLRRVEERGGGRFFHDAAVLHHGDTVGGLRDDGEIVRDEEHGEAVLLAQVAEEGEDLRLHGDVEGGGGFVGDEQAGLVDDGHGDEDALALAAGELVRIVAETLFCVGQGDLVHGFEDAGAEFGAGDVGMVGTDGFGDLVADAHDGVEGGHGFLEDHGDAAATVGAHFLFWEGEEVFAVEENFAGGDGVGREQAEDGEGCCGFAGAGFADEAEDFAGRDGEIDVVHDGTRAGLGAEGDGEVADVEQRGHKDRVQGLEVRG